jgi:hypothetical protein
MPGPARRLISCVLPHGGGDASSRRPLHALAPPLRIAVNDDPPNRPLRFFVRRPLRWQCHLWLGSPHQSAKRCAFRQRRRVVFSRSTYALLLGHRVLSQTRGKQRECLFCIGQRGSQRVVPICATQSMHGISLLATNPKRRQKESFKGGEQKACTCNSTMR